ncbi:MAG: hypothetical protein ACYCSS_08690 [Sulfuriferula sp.]
MSALEQKLIVWFQHPAIQSHNWDVRLFWQAVDARHPFGRLKIDPRELEVLFAALMDEPSECLAGLNAESASRGDYLLRGDFLTANARRHELPLLTRIYVSQE